MTPSPQLVWAHSRVLPLTRKAQGGVWRQGYPSSAASRVLMMHYYCVYTLHALSCGHASVIYTGASVAYSI